MPDYHYKSDAPATVAIVSEYYQAKAQFLKNLEALGELFGGKVAPMRSGDSSYAGGVKLSDARELDVHWCRPDQWGHRALRSKAVPPKGTDKKARAHMHAEHERLTTLWRENVPAMLHQTEYWNRLSVNTGNLLLCGGVMFEHQGVAYFHLGFEINKGDHDSEVAAGKPTSGWIEGAIEIFPSEYEAARAAKLEARQ